MRKFAFVLWNPGTNKVAMKVICAKDALEAAENCVTYHKNHGYQILTMCEIPK